MDNDMFDELLESVRQAKAIRKGEREPSRKFEVGEPDAKAIRQNLHLTQERFATLLGISVGTLRNWEQGRRKPDGAAKVLLMVAEKHPEAVLDVV